MQNDKLLGTSLTENYNFFYYSKFNLKNTIFITDKNIFQFIKLLVKLFNIKNNLSSIYSNIEIPPYYFIKI